MKANLQDARRWARRTLRRSVEAPERVWPRLFLYGMALALLAFWLTPLLWLVSAAFKSSRDLFHYTFFPPPSKLSVESFERLFGTYRLMPDEIRDWTGLARTLRDAGRADEPSPGRRIWTLLEAGGREAVARAAEAETLGPDEEDAVLSALNGVLARPDLYEAEAFAGAALSHPARELLERPRDRLPPEEVEHLNRLLLESAFPQAIARGLSGLPFLRWLMNSLFVTSTVVLVQMFFSSLGGFALAKYRFRGKGPIMVLMLITMMIPMPMLLAPLYELIYRVGLMDRLFGLIVPAAVSVYGMFLFRMSMLGVPDELLEAGRIDGCSEFRLYWNIALPVSRPMIGAFCLIAFMTTWNSFLWPQIILQTGDRFTLTVGLTNLVGTYTEQYGLMLAGTLLAILPVMVLFFILQREFIAGLTAGAVKG